MTKNSVPTSQKTHSVFITETKRLMLFREIIVVYIRNIQIHWADKMQSFCMVKLMVHIVTIVF
jgi:hypothetical protein